MPTYEDMRTYFDQSELLQSIVREVSGVSIVTGFTIDIHPLWIFLYDLEEGAFSADLFGPVWLNHFLHYLSAFHAWPFPEWPMPVFQGYRRRDLKRKIVLWEGAAQGRGAKFVRDPIVLTIVHRPICTPVGDGPNRDEIDRLRLLKIANASSAFVRVEERPQARLALAPGDTIRTSRSRTGTCGGTFTDSSGNEYGMSCAHVAECGDTIADSAGSSLGTCVHHTNLVALANNIVCDPVNLAMPDPSPGNGPSVNMLDFSLIRLNTPTAVTRRLRGTAASLTIGQDVHVNGARTKKTKCRLGALAISYSIAGDGKFYCFRDVIELQPQPSLGLGGRCSTLFSRFPQQGDSGAWVLTNDEPPAWAGVFFAVDGRRGFCVRANWAKDWAEHLIGPLQV